MNTATEITQGARVKILKGMREAWDCKNARYTEIRIREVWTVESLTQNQEDGICSLLLSCGSRKVRMCVSTASKLKRPAVNLNTGDPTRQIRVSLYTGR